MSNFNSEATSNDRSDPEIIGGRSGNQALNEATVVLMQQAKTQSTTTKPTPQALTSTLIIQGVCLGIAFLLVAAYINPNGDDLWKRVVERISSMLTITAGMLLFSILTYCLLPKRLAGVIRTIRSASV